jgi:hypothetical protein
MANRIKKKKLLDYAVQATHAINQLQIGFDSLRQVVVAQNKHIDELRLLMSKKADIQIEPVKRSVRRPKK